MKRYIIFAFGYYYPLGGAADVIGMADSINEIEEVIRDFVSKDTEDRENFNILDTNKNLVLPNKDIIYDARIYPWGEVKDNCLKVDPDLNEEKWNSYFFKNLAEQDEVSFSIGNRFLNRVDEIGLAQFLRMVKINE